MVLIFQINTRSVKKIEEIKIAPFTFFEYTKIGIILKTRGLDIYSCRKF